MMRHAPRLGSRTPALALLLLLAACTTSESTDTGPCDPTTGCCSDNDCKGDRVCDMATRTCRDPGVVPGRDATASDGTGTTDGTPGNTDATDPNADGGFEDVDPTADARPNADATPGQDAVAPGTDATTPRDAGDGGNGDTGPRRDGGDGGPITGDGGPITGDGGPNGDAGPLVDAGVKGPCCQENPTRGCADPLVEQCVCNGRPECCTQQWTAACAARVESAMCGVCAAVCGDNRCEAPEETAASCCRDCGGGCGDGICCAAAGENACSCASDCNLTPSFCGDGICCARTGETTATCCQDCGAQGAAACGDGVCCRAGGENQCTCRADCGATTCGNNVCECDETCSSCPGDCGVCRTCCEEAAPNTPGCSDRTIEACVCRLDPQCCTSRWDFACVARVTSGGCGTCTRCGDNRCDAPAETTRNCCQDCGATCGDGTCNCGEEACTCPQDCGAAVSCGNGSCDCPNDMTRAERTTNCCEDCGTRCGDGVCNCTENRCNCSTDCGLPVCGDGVCECNENCGGCAGDCGQCSTCSMPRDITANINGPNVIGSTSGAPDFNVGSCARFGGGHEIVFSISPMMSMMITISTDNPGTDYDTLISARTTCTMASTEVACNDNINMTGNNRSRITVTTNGTSPIFIIVEGRDPSQAGRFELSLR